eukprot:TRINITY_DN7477_c0_g1_i1.p1 TRINITY_DN7477_c0_g1~~TRINITY_DN7477_c0_g1_i1.p1  ORF type:complete len:511 (-),score=60.09 TRINITY_DN7477_c0_g1_i1:355-1887(-)
MDSSRARSSFSFSGDTFTSLSTTDIVVFCSCLVALLVGSVAPLFFWLRRQQARRLGKYGRVVSMVLEGHQKACEAYAHLDDDAGDDLKEDAIRAAGALYLDAILQVYLKAFGEETLAGTDTACRVDQALMQYNREVGLGAALAVAFCCDADEVVPTLVSCIWEDCLGVEIDAGHRAVFFYDTGAVVHSGLRVGDRLVALNNEDVASLTTDAIHRQLQCPGRATFQRDNLGGDARSVVVCSRCASKNSIEDSCLFFKCYSCFAVAVPWNCLATAAPNHRTSSSKLFSWCRYSATANAVHSVLPEVSWEVSGLQSIPKHPMGFGTVDDPPQGCQHHTQVGAQCGLAAVNNLITNCDLPAVTVAQMVATSNRLGQAEIAIRDGKSSVEESGHQQLVSELYATEGGGHFDVQTLQLTFAERGFQMTYVVEESKAESLHDQDCLVGYIVHRKDPVSSIRDHWFVVRPHRGGSPRMLLQDSLYENVFQLTTLETQQLLSNLAPGSLFAVTYQQVVA